MGEVKGKPSCTDGEEKCALCKDALPSVMPLRGSAGRHMVRPLPPQVQKTWQGRPRVVARIVRRAGRGPRGMDRLCLLHFTQKKF